jgi:hypothetical protein
MLDGRVIEMTLSTDLTQHSVSSVKQPNHLTSASRYQDQQQQITRVLKLVGTEIIW